MKRGNKNIKLFWILGIIVLIAIVGAFYFSNKITGRAVDNQNFGNEQHSIGPSAEEQKCMMECMQCESIGVNCKRNQQECQTKCNTQKPESTSETSCMEKCVLVGCNEYDFSCQTKNQEKCEKECNMIKEPEAKSEEEQCIRDCVNMHSPKTICKPSSEGEQGNDVCQMCAQQCVHLYAGPCLNEEKLESAKKECQTCEHCYGEPIMGDSGEGWECIVNVECKDASSEFGDEPGSGPGVGQEGFVAKTGEAIRNFLDEIGNFIGNLFGKGEAQQESPSQGSE